MRDRWRRAAGACVVVASVGSALDRGQVSHAMRGVPAELSDVATGLLTIALAIIGTLLLCGSKLFADPKASAPPTPPIQIRRDLTVKRLLATGSPEAVLLDTRHGVALIVAYKALAIVAEKRALPAERLSDQAGMAYRRSAVRGRP